MLSVEKRRKHRWSSGPQVALSEWGKETYCKSHFAMPNEVKITYWLVIWSVLHIIFWLSFQETAFIGLE